MKNVKNCSNDCYLNFELKDLKILLFYILSNDFIINYN